MNFDYTPVSYTHLTHISHIRKKIKSITNEDYIQTIWGIGYKMK